MTVQAQAPKDDTLATLYAGAMGRVEYVSCSGRRRGRGGRANSKHLHIVLPLSGSFLWHPGKDEIFADTETAVFAGGEEDFEISHPVGGDRSLVIWPTAATLEAMTRSDAKQWSRHSAFAARTRRTPPAVHRDARALLVACSRSRNAIEVEETLARLLLALIDESSVGGGGAGARRTIAQAKALLQERLPERLTLAEIAAAIGVSPVYLTQLFRCVEGVPLYQYALNLRLATALDALGASDDITRLAIDSGFSSHSHFTAAFRRRYGVTPSKLRDDLARSEAPTREVRPLCAARGGVSDWAWS